MTSLAGRVAMIEAVVTRLAASRGERVSAAMKLARQRSLAGEQVPLLHDLAELEAEAKLPGLRGQMARAAIRMVRGPPPCAVERKDAVALGAGHSGEDSSIATRSTALYRP